MNHPELAPFVVSNVRFTGGETIGAGSYGSVEEVAIPGAICAAKQLHGVLKAGSSKMVSPEFVKECQMLTNLRHPHIVQFLGICVLPLSKTPTAFMVMERMLTSLHDLLDPTIEHPTNPSIKPSFPLSLKYAILNNVASGLTYLHEQSPPIIHRDLSARNILLNSGMVAKIADLGMARTVTCKKTAASMTKAPGASVYMPPEALENCPGDMKRLPEDRDKKAKYDASIDIFSFGVVSIFTLCQTFPCDLLLPTYRKGDQHIARTELERRANYMQMIYSTFHKEHHLVQMIERCLDFPERRPGINKVKDMLEQAHAEDRRELVLMNTLELHQALEAQTMKQVRGVCNRII